MYEGFGFPVIEAFACGTPLAASNASSIPEAAGEAALLFDPKDTADMSNTLRRLLSDDALRASLKKKGLERVAAFTWRKTAQEMVRILGEIA